MEILFQKRRVLRRYTRTKQRWKNSEPPSCCLYVTIFVSENISHCSKYNAEIQTFLEKTKSMYVRHYNGMPLEKVTPTVGLNGKVIDNELLQ